MVIFALNGWTSSIGTWEIEAYQNYDDAKRAYMDYVSDYNAIDENGYATCEEGNFWMEEVEVR